MDRLLQLADRLALLAAALAGVCLLAMTGLMLAEVVARSFLGSSLTFSWEFSGYLMGAAFLFGAAHTLRTGGHVRVLMLPELLPARMARTLEWGTSLVGLAVAGFLAWSLLVLAYTSGSRGVVSFTPTETPLVIPQGMLAAGAVLLVVQFLARLVRLYRGEPTELGASAEVGS